MKFILFCTTSTENFRQLPDMTESDLRDSLYPQTRNHGYRNFLNWDTDSPLIRIETSVGTNLVARFEFGDGLASVDDHAAEIASHGERELGAVD